MSQLNILSVTTRTNVFRYSKAFRRFENAGTPICSTGKIYDQVLI
ncbi:Uncharacterized protein dnm_066070 [Desulfonema magnum]|uniref:Uncharacterized protein n=1 Tax=Desulfonema magnum TaxID=45655 RepID=A0A975BRU0_9BACT|nr:Uncharacterized protein dnm_066070 [Desulfonema magnum]